MGSKVIAGNWKMHIGPERVDQFLAGLGDSPGGTRVMLFPPAISLPALSESDSRPSWVEVGVQNIHWEERGAFTGEISAPMALQAGATLTLIGHSERRQLFGEHDDDVRRKVGSAFAHGLEPVICVGETLDEREAGKLVEVIVRQLGAALTGLGGDVPPFAVAYEPVWAIGTGRTATPADASEAHGHLRRCLAGIVGEGRTPEVPILYGGSVKPENAAELLAADEVDGVLVGGASLNPSSFQAIIDAGGGV